MLSSEVRQIAAHKELLIVNDTAPPIKAAYPPLAVIKQKYISSEYGKPRVFYLGDIDTDFKFAESADTSNVNFSASASSNNSDQAIFDDEKLDRIVDETISEVINEIVISTENEEIKMKNFTAPLNEDEDIASRIDFSVLENVSEQPEISEVSPVILSKTYKPEEDSDTENSDADFDALNGLSEAVRTAHQEIEARAEIEISRSVI
jgi:hypothetical protein